MTVSRFNFRAYIKPYNKIYKVYSIENDGTFFSVQCFRENNILLKRNDDGTNLLLFTEGEFDLMQSTGLVDVNGKEIYEGDIVEVLEFDKKEDRIQVILFNDCKYQAVSIWGKDIKDKTKIDICGNSPFGERWRMKVIGNIFENKDLLKN